MMTDEDANVAESVHSTFEPNTIQVQPIRNEFSAQEERQMRAQRARNQAGFALARSARRPSNRPAWGAVWPAKPESAWLEA
jgi:hypothetical protein